MKRVLLGFGLLVIAAIARADTPPDWAIGKFHGINRHYNAEMDLSISPDGQARAVITYSSGRTDVNGGYYSRGRLVLNDKIFDISKTGGGIKTVQQDDRLNVVMYQRTSKTYNSDQGWTNWGGPGNNAGDWGTRPQSWMIGRFQGYNGHYDTEQNMTIQSNGRVTVEIRYRQSGRRQTQTGRVQDGTLTIDGNAFRIERAGNGIKTTQASDRLNWVKYERIGGLDPDYSSENGDSLPSWLVGRFSGYNRYYGADMILNGNGSRVTINVNHRDGSRQTQYGVYRNNRLYVDGIEFTVERVGRGIRMTQVDDRANSVTYDRDR